MSVRRMGDTRYHQNTRKLTSTRLTHFRLTGIFSPLSTPSIATPSVLMRRQTGHTKLVKGLKQK
jgi:hypothetical protein